MQTFTKKVQIFALICLVIISVSFIGYRIQNAITANQYQIDLNLSQLTKQTQKELHCLAENIYFEARNEPVNGMIGVAFVTMNRVNSGKYPSTICDVVKQKINGTCQFSWWCESQPYQMSVSKVLTKENNPKYNEIMKIALYFYANHEKIKDPTKGALYYHADYVNPGWKNVVRTKQIGRHIFYEERV